jgi:hypothetical protein
MGGRHALQQEGIMAAETATETSELVTLYRRAFEHHRSRALWNVRVLDYPTPEDALVVARALRVEGNLAARALAERIEQVCRAPH